MTTPNQYAAVYLNAAGDPLCVAGPGCVPLPAASADLLNELCNNLRLGLDLVVMFGGLPRPVAQEILNGLGPVREALELALHDQAATGAAPESEAL